MAGLAFISVFQSASATEYETEYNGDDTVTALQEKARELSRDKPLLVDFYMQNCSSCRKLDQRIEKLQESLGEDFPDFSVLKVDAERYLLHEQFGIQYAPTLQFYKEGCMVGQTDLRMTEERLKAALNKTQNYVCNP